MTINILNNANDMEECKVKTEKTMCGFEVTLEDLGKTPRSEQLETSKLKLDVGCGVVGSGDVNCDLYVKDIGHRLTGNMINTKRIKNFVACDAQKLPFKDGAFNWVYSSHVIEHVDNPFAMLIELLRGSRLRVTIRCPHRFERLFKYSPYHKNFFNATWFGRNLKKFNYSVIANVIRHKPFPYEVVNLWNVPVELQIEIVKSNSPEIAEIIARAGIEYACEVLEKVDNNK